MLQNNNLLSDTQIILSAQQDIIKKLQQSIDKTKSEFNEIKDRIAQLNKMLDQIEQNADFLTLDDFKTEEHNSLDQPQIQTYFKEIHFEDWNQFVAESYKYCVENNIEPFVAYEAFLTKKDLRRLNKIKNYSDLAWDKWDFIIVGIAAVVAALSDLIIVKTPKESKVTEFLKNNLLTNERDNWWSKLVKRFEKEAKVPFDKIVLDGMSPNLHRLQTLGHDPILGFIFGTLDIMRGTITGFAYDKSKGIHTFVIKKISEEKTINIIKAFLLELKHLISDISTSQGLPPPFFTVLQANNLPSGIKNKTIAELAREMYQEKYNYDFRHFFTTGISPGFIEAIIRGYHWLSLKEKGVEQTAETKLKLKTMLLAAHSLAVAINTGKVIILQDPLKINYAQWLAAISYFVPVVRELIFNKVNVKLEKLAQIQDERWTDLLIESHNLLSAIYNKFLPQFQIKNS